MRILRFLVVEKAVDVLKPALGHVFEKVKHQNLI